MTTSTLDIPYLQSGGLITNYYCSSSCRHCLYRCSPAWPLRYIDCKTTQEIFSILKARNCYTIHIGGGEPFIDPDALIIVLQEAQRADINIEYIETNSSWFRTDVETESLLSRLRACGVSTLLLSMSPFHNEYIPFYKVKGLIKACRNSGVGIIGWTWELLNDIESFEERSVHTLEEYEERFGEEYLASLAQRYWISHGGRALEFLGKLQRKKTIPRLLSQNSGGCSELGSGDHFHFDLFGNYIPGLCAGWSIRSEDLLCGITSQKYPLLNLMYRSGIRGLLNFAMEEFGFEVSRGTYFSKCELCYEIRKFLVIEAKLSSHELCPVEHYTL